MSADQPPRWNDDILAHIFVLAVNTHTPPESDYIYEWRVPYKNPLSALDTARHASQACRSWRMLLLHSPSIWGNLIDLDRLTRASDNWFEEVLRRTGEASLSIFGQVNQQSKLLLTSLLENQWHRVRKLDLDCPPNISLTDINWDIIWTRPAPILETLIIPIVQMGFSLESDKLFQCFAPSLGHFHTPFCFRFDLSSPWLSQLRSLTLTDYVRTFDVLTILSHCSARLESLAILWTWTEASVKPCTWTQSIHLPLLGQINLCSDVLEVPLYLSNIVPGPDCVLSLTTAPTDESVDMDVHIWEHVANLVIPYVQNYFRICGSTKLAISLSSDGISIQRPKWDDELYLGYQWFCLDFEAATTFTMEIADILLGSLCKANFDNILHLELYIHTVAWLQPDCVLFQVLLSMTSVQTITATPRALKMLNRRLNSSPLFPQLISLDINPISLYVYTNEVSVYPDEVDVLERGLTEFLLHYKEENQYLTLDITDCFQYIAAERWRFLDKIIGLKVMYKGSRYVCSHEESIEEWIMNV